MKKKSIEDIDVKGKCVFARVDFNVPLGDAGEITDDIRIRASLPTLQYLVTHGARIVCASHLETPGGEKKPELTLPPMQPVVQRLSQLLGQEVIFSEEIVGEEVEILKSQLKEGDILLLQNLKSHPGETRNDTDFARELSKNIDIYVNDTLGASIYSHASIQAITECVPVSAAGLLLKKEIDYLTMALENPPKNYTVIIGGARISDKIHLITHMIHRAHKILIGGGIAYTFLKAKGVDVGGSKVEEDYFQLCRDILQKAEEKNVKLLLPVDHIAAISIEPEVTIRMIKRSDQIPEEMMGLDIGFETIRLFTQEMKDAELIVWNGPLGVFEIETFSAGTVEIAKEVAASSATSIIGGDALTAAIHKTGVSQKISFLSSGGVAMRQFLSGQKLPGIESLSEE
jgi:3-phosphoglycerate kinase